MNKIYLAAASNEIMHAKYYIGKLQEYGYTVTHDWTKDVENNGGIANPRDADNETLLKYAMTDLVAVQKADLVWLLIPECQTAGAWIEFGFAIGAKKPVFVSGDWRKSLFTSLAKGKFDTHELALASFYDAR